MIECKSIEEPEETLTFDRGRLDLVWVGGTTVARGTFEPGFRWSECLKAKAGTESCELSHVGIVISGRLRVALDGGEEKELRAGDVFSIPAGHDTWVVGDEPVVLLDFTGDDHLFKMLEWSGTHTR